MADTPHAKTSDIPGWPCPARVSDIPGQENSWGFVPLYPRDRTIVFDEEKQLWVDGDLAPAFTFPHESFFVGAVVFWTLSGIGAYFTRSSLKNLKRMSQLDLRQDPKWLPIVDVAADLPGFVKEDE